MATTFETYVIIGTESQVTEIAREFGADSVIFGYELDTAEDREELKFAIRDLMRYWVDTEFEFFETEEEARAFVEKCLATP